MQFHFYVSVKINVNEKVNKNQIKVKSHMNFYLSLSSHPIHFLSGQLETFGNFLHLAQAGI